MSWTKQELIDEARAAADATGSSRWNNTTIARLLDTVYRREWSRLLSANPVYRWGSRSVTTDSDGRFDIADLSIEGERFYRILQIQEGEDVIPPLQGSDQPYAGATSSTLASRAYYFIGDTVQVLPVSAGSNLTVYVNHIPDRVTDLDSAEAVIFPDDYEMILAYECAAFMLAKGSAETGAQVELRELAEEMRTELLSEVSRRVVGPTFVAFPDRSEEWAG